MQVSIEIKLLILLYDSIKIDSKLFSLRSFPAYENRAILDTQKEDCDSLGNTCEGYVGNILCN